MDKIYELKRRLLYSELAGIWHSLENVDYAVIKGEALSMQIYGEPHSRYSGDIDILIDRSNVKRLEKELLIAGFIQDNTKDTVEDKRKKRILCFTHSHQIPPYSKEKLNITLNVDVNFDIYWGEYEGKRIDIKEFLNENEKINLFGSNIKVLSLEKAFIQLILHHYKEMNSIYHLLQYNCIRTDMFRDIKDIIKYNPKELSPNNVLRICEKYHLKPYAYYMLYYAQLVFQSEELSSYIELLENKEGYSLFDKYGLNEKERKKWKINFEKRLNNDQVYKIIGKDMNEKDWQKLQLNKEIFK
ncbi:nucleotidyltransferase family protein [Clostridium sp.]|uniref:nucleotidyltransferase family protein n=1 Tax=Clostridium sp. TaxID=1506 RepID=UPI003F348695